MATNLSSELEDFVGRHARCGTLTGDVGEVTPNGYAIEIACSCGVVFMRWITPREAAKDVLLSRLAPSTN